MFLATVLIRRYCYIAVILASFAATAEAAWSTIHNDFFQTDQNGNSVQTRSGCLCKFGDTYYWYGCVGKRGDSGFFRDQTCYTSRDLMHWTYKGVVYRAVKAANRMDVLYNDSTKQYVMILKNNDSAGMCDIGIATSPTPDGQFTLKSDSQVFGYKIGDMSVYQDDDGKAYLLYVWDSIPGANSGGVSQHALALLSPDYLSVQKRLWLWNAGSREAPMMMKRNGMYYYMTSLTLWTQPTATQYYTAPGPAGPWTTRLTPMITPGSTVSWETQCDYVFTIKGTQGTVYMYCGDRWEKPNELRQGDYAWLPITFSPRDSAIVNYYQDWEVDLHAGQWRPFDYRRNLAKRKTATASSQAGSNIANNVTDSMTYSNFTSTRWTSATADSQWIQVDLGSSMSINRVILKWDTCFAKSFKIQVSGDASAWRDVYGSTSGGRRSVTDETFAATTARYVRMYGTERGDTTLGYSLFDFMVLNDSVTTAIKPKSGTSVLPARSSLTCRNNTVHYSVDAASIVRLEVVDISGKRVALLADEYRRAGCYEAAVPKTLGSGFYIVRLTVGAKRTSVFTVRF